MIANKRIKYNPAFLSQDELIKTFVVRYTELELIMEVIHENTGPTNQHLVVVGPRGSGKTTLVLRVAAEVRRTEELSNLWYSIVFPEESYGVCSPGEFWLEALFRLGEQVDEKRWKDTYRELRSERDEARLRERALSQLLDFANEQKKKLLFIVENLNMLLGQQISSDDAWALRHTFVNEPHIMLLGTATSRFEHLENANKAMFELFKIHELKPLDSYDCSLVWESITGQKPQGERLRPIQILTGGNPRLLVIISTFAAKVSFRELMDNLTKLVDEHTEYFKSHLDNLPPLERKVFVALADLWQPSTARELAETARIDINKASAYLKRLVSKGAVVEVDEKGRKKWYQLAERMYNIYHLMRHRGELSNRVRAVVDFMVHFYAGEDLVRTTASIAAEACKLAPALRYDHYKAIEEVLKSPQIDKYREKIIKQIPKQFFESPDLPELFRTIRTVHQFVPPTTRDILSEEEIQAVLPQNPNDPMAWVRLAEALLKEGDRYKDAEKACRAAIKLDSTNIIVWKMLGLLLIELDSFEEAEEAYRKATEIDPRDGSVWLGLGRLLQHKLGKYAEAEEDYIKAIDIDPNNKLAWGNLGALLHFDLQRYEEAEQAYRKAIEIDPSFELAWRSLGLLLEHHLQHYEEAEIAYRKSIELDPNEPSKWGQLGMLLHDKLQRYEEAEQAYRKAIDIEPNDGEVWGRLGLLLQKDLQRYEEAEKAYRKAVKINPNASWVWINLGDLLSDKLQRYDEAEQAYRKAIRIDPKDAFLWARLGFLLMFDKLHRFEEAEQSFRKAIKINTDATLAWGGLGFLLHDNLERYDEAEKAYKKVIELQPNDAFIWGQLGMLLHDKLQRYEEAEQAYRKAIEIEPESSLSWIRLIELYMDAMHNPELALKTAEEFLEASESSVESLNNLAWIFFERNWQPYLENAEAWSRAALSKNPSAAFQHTLASVLGALGKWSEALGLASQFLADEELIGHSLREVTDLFINAAASGYAEKALCVLEQHLDKLPLETLVAGLKIFLGKEIRMPQEITEVGYDVAKRINERMTTPNKKK